MLNVVFDLGGVVFTWQPDRIIENLFEDPEIQKKIKSEIFAHSDWVELDRGSLDVDEAIKRGAKRTGLSRSKISELMSQVPTALNPIEETIELIHSIKRNGNKLFVLSNMHFASIEHIEKEYSFWDVFEGMVVSCRIRMVKPDAEIYEYLLNRHKLVPNETVFIDDTDINLMAASNFHIKTIKFENPNQCKTELKALGCI